MAAASPRPNLATMKTVLCVCVIHLFTVMLQFFFGYTEEYSIHEDRMEKNNNNATHTHKKNNVHITYVCKYVDIFQQCGRQNNRAFYRWWFIVWACVYVCLVHT